MVDASVARLLDRDPLVFYSASFAADPDELRAEVHPRLVQQLGLPNRAEALALVAGLRRDMWQNQSTAA